MNALILHYGIIMLKTKLYYDTCNVHKFESQ